MPKNGNPFAIQTNDREADSVLVGGYVPRPFADLLSLYAVRQSTTRAAIVTTLLNRLPIPPRDRMIRELAQRASQEWSRRRAAGTKQTLAEYREEAAERLRKRKVNEKDIESIIRQIGAWK